MFRNFLFRQGRRRVCFLFFLLLSWAGVALGQDFRGSLLVIAEDSGGGRTAGAVVTLTQEKSAGTRTTKANTRGEARFDALQPGTYSVKIEAVGFAEKTTRVGVTVSSAPTLAVTLAP